MLFIWVMEKKRIYLYIGFAIVLLFAWILSRSSSTDEDFPERVKISLRDVGNQLLLSNQDSTTLVLPITVIGNHKYQLSFGKELMFEPNTLVDIVKSSFQKAGLPNYYRVEVVQCTDGEVGYSYEIKNHSEQDIIPCAGRYLPNGCYLIQAKFTKMASFDFAKQLISLGVLLLIVLFLWDYMRRNKQSTEVKDHNDGISLIGSYRFHAAQNKLMHNDKKTSLSKKECELLILFVANLNKIITRDELTKRVWEDNGVMVGRSLDTYVSKLRKKLMDDPTVKLSNVHGVGYKLEVGFD